MLLGRPTEVSRLPGACPQVRPVESVLLAVNQQFGELAEHALLVEVSDLRGSLRIISDSEDPEHLCPTWRRDAAYQYSKPYINVDQTRSEGKHSPRHDGSATSLLRRVR
jgi:hypothetical protein